MSVATGDPIDGSAASGAAPHGRATWSGLLQFRLLAVPVKAYTAVSTTEGIHFNQLHADCGQRIRYEKRCPVHGPVDSAAIQRGYQYAPGQYVVVEPAELEKLRPAKDRGLILEQFVDPHQIDPVFFSGRSLYLLPEGPPAQHPYDVLCDAMRQGSKQALGRIVLSGSRQLVLVRPGDRWLTMHILHYPAQVRAAPGEQPRFTAAPTSEELQLATMLIDSASKPIDWRAYRDESTEELTALIEAKIAGRPLTAPAEQPAVVLSLLEALKQSVAATAAPAPPAASDSPNPDVPSEGEPPDDRTVSADARHGRPAVRLV